MKTTGVVRKVDELGRVVIPIELRRHLGINIKDPLEIFVEGDTVLMRKYEQTCIFCGSSQDVALYKRKRVCAVCLEELKNATLVKE